MEKIDKRDLKSAKSGGSSRKSGYMSGYGSGADIESATSFESNTEDNKTSLEETSDHDSARSGSNSSSAGNE